jgi:uncharacterized DUF497 family protein
MQVEWDEAKNRANQRKHRVAFETAERVFLDLFAWHKQDRSVAGEERWQTMGEIEGRILLVAHTWPDDESIRIISARKATPLERKRYYAHRSP